MYSVPTSRGWRAIRRRRYHRGARVFDKAVSIISPIGPIFVSPTFDGSNTALLTVFVCLFRLFYFANFRSFAIRRCYTSLHYISFSILFSTHSTLCARAHSPLGGNCFVLPNSGLFGRFRSTMYYLRCAENFTQETLMGSFTSTVKIDNEDSQDKDLKFENHVTYQQLLEYCRTHDNQWPNSQLIKRTFTSIPYDPDSVDGNPVRVLQWNVLSQALGQNNDRFDSCPLEALEWKHRRCHMLEEILRYNPDIICLQEVDHFDFLSRALATQSYSGLFVPKPDSPCVYINDNNGPDGCAIFYKNDKFDLLEKHDKILQVWTVHSNQVSLLLILKDKSTQKELCVATTHLKARKGALLSTLRNEQGKDLLQFISSHAAGRPTIVCGDFNAEPTEPVYSTMCSCSYLPLDSAYKLSGSEPLYTSWKIRGGEGEVMHTIDYMFYTKHKLTVSNILDMPKEIDIGENRVPSMTYPSDHFSLISDFYFNTNTNVCE